MDFLGFDELKLISMVYNCRIVCEHTGIGILSFSVLHRDQI